MKPLGMTASFQIVSPDRVQDAVWDAVEKAIDAGWSVDQFRRESRDCWIEYARRKAEDDRKDWER